MVLSKIGDSDLIVLYINGNEQAFETLLMRHKDRIFRYILSKLKDSDLANDVFQDTFVKVVNTIRLGNYNEEGKFLPWAMRIAHNLVIDHFRRQNKMRTISESSSFDPSYSIFHKIDSGDKNYIEQTHGSIQINVVRMQFIEPSVYPISALKKVNKSYEYIQ